jgi:hypothetical protein
MKVDNQRTQAFGRRKEGAFSIREVDIHSIVLADENIRGNSEETKRERPDFDHADNAADSTCRAVYEWDKVLLGDTDP